VATTVKISTATVRQLKVLQRRLGTKSLDETIRVLLREHRRKLLDSSFGAYRGKVSEFREEDRGEDRS
jgi:hypothetical protein